MDELPPADYAAGTDRRWLTQVLAGDGSRQLTVRAVVTGMVLGAVLALCNLYVALKTGFGVGVTLTAAILAFAIWSLLRRIVPRLAPFEALENNAMQSVASAAGFMTAGGTVAAIPALMLLTGYRFTPLAMMAWVSVLALLGVFVAIPLKRQLINVEQLRFPSGVAAAETVRSLHAEGPEARTKARTLGLSAIVGGLVAVARDALGILPAQVPVFGRAAAQYTISADMSLMMVGAGAIMGLRATLSQLAGSALCYGVLAPWARSVGAITGDLRYKNIVGWSVWIGASMMLTAGLLHFALSWRAVRRAFADVARIFRPADPVDDPLAHIEVPTSWFLGGFVVLGAAAVALQRSLFGIPVWMGVISVLLSWLVGVVSARATGETDAIPSGAMGKFVQLVFSGLHPGSITTNLATAHVAGGVAIHASDLLTDLKSGYLLGARPRQQFFAQFFGVLAGSVAVVPAYLLLIPDVSAIGSDRAGPSGGARAGQRARA
jgi:uncharacterized oligopeptide transporter (OPT) family protein